MAIEVATYIGDLQPLNPPSTDPVSQGDDHVRLIKAVLQNSFPALEKAIYFGTVLTKSANYTVLATDANSDIQVDTTSGAVTLTLPTLGVNDVGWKIRVIKTSRNTNPIFIAPASGNLNSGGYSGLAKARRCIAGVHSTVSWDGTNWFVSRPVALPPGSLIPCQGGNLPPGYEWPNGQTLASVATNYPELNAEIGTGVLLDKRGRVGIALDNLGGSSAGRLSGGIITGTAIGNNAGTDIVTLTTGQIPAHSHTTTENPHSHGHGTGSLNFNGNASGYPAVGADIVHGASPGSTDSAVTGLTINNAGGGGSHSNLQPSIMVSEIMLAE